MIVDVDKKNNETMFLGQLTKVPKDISMLYMLYTLDVNIWEFICLMFIVKLVIWA